MNLRSTAVKRIMQEASELADPSEDDFIAAPLEVRRPSLLPCKLVAKDDRPGVSDEVAMRRLSCCAVMMGLMCGRMISSNGIARCEVSKTPNTRAVCYTYTPCSNLIIFISSSRPCSQSDG